MVLSVHVRKLYLLKQCLPKESLLLSRIFLAAMLNSFRFYI